MANVVLKNDSTATIAGTLGDLVISESASNLNIDTTATNGVLINGKVAVASTHGIGTSDGTYSSIFKATASGTTSYTLDLPHALPASSSAVVNDGSNALTYYSQGFTSNANLAVFFAEFGDRYDNTTTRRFQIPTIIVHSDPSSNITQTTNYLLSLEPGTYEVTCAFGFTVGGGRIAPVVWDETNSAVLGNGITVSTVSSSNAWSGGSSWVTAFQISSTTSISIRDGTNSVYGFTNLATARPNRSSICIRQIM